MSELEVFNELEFFKITNSTFFVKSPTSFLLHISSNNFSTLPSISLSLQTHGRQRHVVDSEIRHRFPDFLSVSLSVKDTADSDDGFSGDSSQSLGQNGDRNSDIFRVSELLEETKEEVKLKSSGAFNTTKHLWAGAVAAMISRFVSISPLNF